MLSAALPSECAARAAAEARKLPVVPAGDPQPTLGLLQEPDFPPLGTFGPCGQWGKAGTAVVLDPDGHAAVWPCFIRPLCDQLCQRHGFKNVTGFKSNIRNLCTDVIFFLLSGRVKTHRLFCSHSNAGNGGKAMKCLLWVGAIVFCS